MRLTMTAAVLAGTLLLTGCGGGGEDEAAANPTAATSSAPKVDDRAAALKVAAQGYVNAMLKGQIAGVLGYLDPQVCDEEDEGEYALGLGAISEVADGATMKVTSVYVEGDQGGVDDYELSKGASDQLRRLVKSSATPGGGREYSWTYRDGEWYLSAPCKDESASPEPSA